MESGGEGETAAEEEEERGERLAIVVSIVIYTVSQACEAKNRCKTILESSHERALSVVK